MVASALAFGETGGRKTVVVPIVVRDQSGADVTDLSASSFEIQDKGKVQPVTKFELMKVGSAGPDGKPTQRFVAYVLDDMLVTDLGDFRDMINAVRGHLASIRPDDRISVLTTSCKASRTDWTNDASKIQQVLQSLPPNRTPLCLGVPIIKELVIQMQSLPGLRAIVIVSPGLALGDFTRQEELLEIAGQSRVIVYGVGVSRRPEAYGNLPADGEGLAEFCVKTGGVLVWNGTDLRVAFRNLKLSEAVYFASFENAKADGALHRLKVTVKDPRKLTVQARNSYRAPMH